MNTFFTAPYNASTRTNYLKAINTHYLTWGKLQSQPQHEPESHKNQVEPMPGNAMNKIKTIKLNPSHTASNHSKQDA
ncbi:hypothetical protein [Thiohalophilus thiocyanatoxydans]|uniref:Uncharacterized protein n=1 Tax=Thiohalophilus thiocyanatoxydans TaxID=381308 RepID=A0A4R8IPL2_9GAMM|nr:hypothetical protein [Thiohalophilus thiocyanatoxydans]TDY02872.1 hypothetical protein EDC23_1256 [Thiohalophilus thiocyanatoxydans]